MRTIKRSNCAILHLGLKRPWFNRIASGEKREEYRAATPYWAVRLSNWDSTTAEHHVVEFRLGYAAGAPRMAFLSPWYTTTDECRHPDWGEPDTAHFVIILTERVELED